MLRAYEVRFTYQWNIWLLKMFSEHERIWKWAYCSLCMYFDCMLWRKMYQNIWLKVVKFFMCLSVSQNFTNSWFTPYKRYNFLFHSHLYFVYFLLKRKKMLIFKNTMSCGTSALSFYASGTLMPPTRKGAGGIMFSGCPSGNLVNTKSQEPLGGFLSYFAQGCTMTSRWTD